MYLKVVALLQGTWNYFTSNSNRRLYQISTNYVPYQAKLCRAKFSSGEILVTKQKIRHFRPTKKFRPIKVKVPLVEVQMNPREKQFI